MPDAQPADIDAATPTGLECAGGVLDPVSGHCFRLNPNPLPWGAASLACQATGGHLATYTSAAENELVTLGLPLPSDVWIGLEDPASTGVFRWQTGEPLGFTNWEVTQPSGNGDCVEQDVVLGAWNDTPCAELMPSICEREGWVQRPDTGHRYLPLPGPLPWDQASAACGDLGAHLATLTDQAEQDFVLAHVLREEYWLGLSDAAVEMIFVWVTGEPFSFTSWCPGEPSPLPGGDTQDCVRLLIDDPVKGTGWTDQDCVSAKPFVCEID